MTTTASTGGGCTDGLTDCAGTCVDLLTDSQNCGDCGVALPGDQSCVDGQPTCDSAGFAACIDGCKDLANDANNCTGCGYICPSLDEGIDPMPTVCGVRDLPGGGTETTCLGAITVDVRASCTDICQAAAWSCDFGLGYYEGTNGCTNSSLFACGDVPPVSNDAQGCVGDFTHIVCQCWLQPPAP